MSESDDCGFSEPYREEPVDEAITLIRIIVRLVSHFLQSGKIIGAANNI